MSTAPLHRDIIVIGASLGGLEALSEVVSRLPGDLRATIFIVQHLSPGSASVLPELLSRRGAWPASHPTHGEVATPQHIYVAPPDNQLLLVGGRMHVTRGPKENGRRPSVDALFRTAARTYGPRVIGVVLTGHLNCGTAGLLSIKARGGMAVVQDPGEAVAADMPLSALRHVQVDHVVGIAEMTALLIELVASPAPSIPGSVSQVISELEGDTPGIPARIVCPVCRGALSEVCSAEFQLFRCRVGHAFTLECMLAEQTEETERALWAAVRALDESALLAQRMAARSTGDLVARFQEKEATIKREAELIRDMLLSARVSPVLEAHEAVRSGPPKGASEV